MIVRQRKDGDCGIAALAMALELTYEDVYVACADKVDKTSRGGRGLTTKDLLQIAERLKRPMRRVWRPDPTEDEGVLVINWRPRDPGGYCGHYVTVRNGLVLDPSLNTPVTWETWQTLFPAGKHGTLLEEIA